jgi:hypothetical protein
MLLTHAPAGGALIALPEAQITSLSLAKLPRSRTRVSCLIASELDCSTTRSRNGPSLQCRTQRVFDHDHDHDHEPSRATKRRACWMRCSVPAVKRRL